MTTPTTKNARRTAPQTVACVASTPARCRLVIIGVGWVLMAVSQLAIGKLSNPAAVLGGMFAFVAGGLMFVMAMRPASTLAYRIGGTFAIGELFLRFVTFTVVLVTEHEELGLWLAASGMGSTMILAAIYGHWWITEVGPWHEVRRLERECAQSLVGASGKVPDLQGRVSNRR